MGMFVFMKSVYSHTTKCGCTKDISHIIAYAETQTRLKGERFTPLRRDVIEHLVTVGKPVGAYDLLKIMNVGRSKKIAAMSLYRTLDYLQELGIAIRLESQNAYMSCHHDGHDHGHVIMICDDCGTTKEIEEQDINSSLRKIAEKNNLKLRHNVVELHGICSHCQS
jgi:Fur family transcriptional regulator, zinc uptake regulator